MSKDLPKKPRVKASVLDTVAVSPALLTSKTEVTGGTEVSTESGCFYPFLRAGSTTSVSGRESRENIVYIVHQSERAAGFTDRAPALCKALRSALGTKANWAHPCLFGSRNLLLVLTAAPLS